jgi:integrase
VVTRRPNKKAIDHLFQRGGSGPYWLDVSIPPSIRSLYQGKTRLRYSLKTKSVTEAIRLRNIVLRDLEFHKAVAEDEESKDTPANRYSNALEVYKDAPAEALEALITDYESTHNLHSSSNASVADHPTYFAMLAAERGTTSRRREFSPTLAEVLVQFIDKRSSDMAKSTVDGYKKAVKKFGEGVHLSDINLLAVTKWLDDVSGGTSTIRGTLICLAQLWEFSRTRGIVLEDSRNPFRGLKVTGRAKVRPTPQMSQEKLREILDFCRPSYADYFMVLAHTGMRSAEVDSLEIVVKDGIRCYSVTKSKTTSGIRLCPIHPRISNIDITTLPRSMTVRSWLQYSMQQGRLELAEREGLHSLRVNFITSLLSAGVEERLVSRIVGHSAKTITQHYDRGDLKQLHEAVLQLPDPISM